MNNPEGANIDPALLELFRAELDTHIPTLSDGLLALEKGPAGEQEIAAMMRAAHSIKGAARIVGLEEVVRVAHAMEDCFTDAKDNPTSLSGAVDVLLEGLDAIQRCCVPQPESKRDQSRIDSLLERIASTRKPMLMPVVDRPVRTLTSIQAANLHTDQTLSPERRFLLPADLDEVAAARLRTQLCDALRQGALHVRLDFTQVDHVSASALAVLMSFTREAARTAPTLVIIVDGIAGSLAAFAHVTGLDRACSPAR